jgi:hypothetical protein
MHAARTLNEILFGVIREQRRGATYWRNYIKITVEKKEVFGSGKGKVVGNFERCKELRVPLESGESFGEVFACFKRTMVSPN